MSYNLYLDDIRVPKSNVDFVIIRSYNEAVDYVEEHGIPYMISFDHDLGTEKTGYDFAKFLGDKVINEDLKMFKFLVHSANPVGAENINKYLSFIADYKSR